MISERKYPLTLVGIWLAGLVALVARSLQLTDGILMYSLDDPYIHLAVAETILQGGYGINGSEYSSPSSSLLYPLLLAGTESMKLGTLGPLLFNIVAMAGAVYTVGRILADYVWPGIASKSPPTLFFRIGLGLLLCLALNAWGLPLTGMEHSLHIFASLYVLHALLQRVDPASSARPRSNIGLVTAIVALPLLRFEGMALALCAIGALYFLQARRAAWTALGLILLAGLIWYGFTQSIDLPFLPSSVLVKSAISASVSEPGGMTSVLESIAHNLNKAANHYSGQCLAFTLLLVGSLTIYHWKKGARKIACVVGGLTLGTGIAHLLFGNYGWFARYEVYMVSLATLSCVYLARAHLAQPELRIGAALMLFLIGLPYLQATVQTPAATRNIYEQQYQIHRFAVDYWRQPIAVNDLGWVSYRNPEFVLDLWGLGSEEARKILGPTHTRWREDADYASQTHALGALVDRHGVTLIIIYDTWLAKRIPAHWEQIAILKTSAVAAASDTVSFYITPAANRKSVLYLLERFQTTLPSGASLRMAPQHNSE